MKIFSSIKNFFSKINKAKEFRITQNKKYFLAVSSGIIAIGLIVIIFFGLNLGLDFTGGTIINIKLGETLETGTVYTESINTIEDILGNYGVTLASSQKQGEGTASALVIRYQDIKDITEDEMNDISTQIEEDITTAFDTEDYPSFSLGDTQRIGATTSGELVLYAMLALLATMALILVYLALRFEIVSGVVTLIVLLHDVLITVAFVAMLRIQINSSFIAAIITIAGYAINNTILVFDRIRENKANEKNKLITNSEIANMSVKEMFTRILFTSLTTIVMILLLTIIGVASIKEFALPILIGLTSGIYSSMCIAPSLWAVLKDKREKNKSNKVTDKKFDNKDTPIIAKIADVK